MASSSSSGNASFAWCAGLTILCAIAPDASATDSLTSVVGQLRGGVLHVQSAAENAATLANTQIFIDTDADARTGYTGVAAEHGYDVMVEGTTVYTFNSDDPTVWKWDKAGTATKIINGTKLTLDVPAGPLGKTSPKATMLLRCLSSDYKVLASAETTLGSGAAAKPASEFSVKASQDGSDLKLTVTAKSAADLNTVLIFFDTDKNADTGFQPPADPRFGFEFMIQGGSLSKHTGDARGGWSWETVAPVEQTVDGSTASISFNASLLKSTSVKVSAWQMSADWQTRTAFSPADGDKAGTLEVPLDSGKLHTDATMMEVAPAPVHANAADSAITRFHAARTYSCYYGAGKYNELSHVDAAILHIPAQTPESIAALKKLGVVTIGYISVGEDETIRTGNGKGPGGKASWYFNSKNPNAPDENGTWASFFANAADPLWRADRVEQAKHLCGSAAGEWGFDGIFLDTIETVDAYPESREGMIKLVEELHAALPGKVIVINRGFSLLKEPRVSSNIDGLMYESFTDSYDFATKSYLRFAPQDMDSTRVVMQSTVNPVMQKYNLKVLALDYTRVDQTEWIQEAVDRAATFNMLDDVSTISLDAVYPIWTYTPHPNAKFLSQMATPEAIRYTLAADRNGFPAGTVVQPSSCYMGYTAATVVDGIADRGKLDWSKAAWASAETPGAVQDLCFTLPKPVQAKVLSITFATDNGKTFVSKNFDVKYRTRSNGPWNELPTNAATGPTVTCTLPDEPVTGIKIEQAAGGGAGGRPDIMWVAQVSLSQ